MVGCRDPSEGSWGAGWGLKYLKNQKEFDGLIETIPITPHNPGFGWILEMTLLGGHWGAAGTLGPEGKGEVKNENKPKNFDGPVKTIPMIPHNPGFGWILEMTLLGGR